MSVFRPLIPKGTVPVAGTPEKPNSRTSKQFRHLHTDENWKEQKQTIYRLYIEAGETAEDVITILGTYGFKAGRRKLFEKFEEWGFKKNKRPRRDEGVKDPGSSSSGGAVPIETSHFAKWQPSIAVTVSAPLASTRRNKLIEKRVKLQDVRSCLQCKMRKISCSENKLDPSEPCDLCMTQARRAKDLTMLYLTVDCIRTTFSEVDVFEYAVNSNGPIDLAISSFQPSAVITAFAPTSLDQLVDCVVSCLSGSVQCLESFPAVILSSHSFDLMAGVLNPKLVERFQLLLNTTILAHINSNHLQSFLGCPAETIQHIGYTVGHGFLPELEKILSLDQTLMGRMGLQSLFIVTIGTLMAVQYSNIPRSLIGSTYVTKSVLDMWSSMKEHVERMLRHYVIHLAAKMELALPSNAHELLSRPPSLRPNTPGNYHKGYWARCQEETKWTILNSETNIEELACTLEDDDDDWNWCPC